MTQSNKLLAVIPARKGSKGLPGKNIKPLAGKPLIEYSIEVAKQSQLFDEICVSSDGEEILNLADALGVSSLKRPDYLAADDTLSIDVVLHALDSYQEQGQTFLHVILLQPTSPLRMVSDLLNAWDLYKEHFEANQTGSVLSVCQMPHHPYKTLVYTQEHLMPLFGEENLSMPRQLLPPTFFTNGAIYINSSEDLRTKKQFFVQPVKPYIMSENKSIDIDSELDFLLCEYLLNRGIL